MAHELGGSELSDKIEALALATWALRVEAQTTTAISIEAACAELATEHISHPIKQAGMVYMTSLPDGGDSAMFREPILYKFMA